MAQNERRKSERKPIHWPVHARNQKLVLVGADACDISPNGIFLRPVGAEAVPVKGDSLILTLFPRPFGQGFVTTGIVEWTGQSDTHEVEGIGIQFNEPDKIRSLIDDVQRLEGEG